MKNKIRLTESDLIELIKKAIKEQDENVSKTDLMEGTKEKKPKPMKSRKSGLKTMATIKKNHEILKKFN